MDRLNRDLAKDTKGAARGRDGPLARLRRRTIALVLWLYCAGYLPARIAAPLLLRLSVPTGLDQEQVPPERRLL